MCDEVTLYFVIRGSPYLIEFGIKYLYFGAVTTTDSIGTTHRNETKETIAIKVSLFRDRPVEVIGRCCSTAQGKATVLNLMNKRTQNNSVATFTVAKQSNS